MSNIIKCIKENVYSSKVIVINNILGLIVNDKEIVINNILGLIVIKMGFIERD